MEEKALQEDEDNKTWQRARWATARKAIADGTFEEPEIRFPVIINGPISSAKKLQRLAEMGSVPEALETTLVREKWISTTKPATICHVNFAERMKLEEKANVEYDVSGKFMVLFRGQRRHAMLVRSLKEGGTRQDPGETIDNRESPGNGKVKE
ncbi:hypothetical protein C8A01DRAFT_17578 [Parachaetomium inaequale]|uniref:Uncharacterized protein n=1 Tax=Parachaetomium inaequale TaxID=2588326 RepID=A0AAN6PEC0_9PEZI|nr:hypothetical protein C8A01DRAFT_17578 [Parachaetomium inaequale]